MKNLTLAHIAEACHGTYVGTEEKKNQEVSSIFTDSLPGMTPTSLIPQEAKVIGMNYPQLCEKLIEVSLKKYQ